MLHIPDMMQAVSKHDWFATIDSNRCGAQTIPPLPHKRCDTPSSGSLNSKTELLILHVEVLGLHKQQ